MGHLYHCATRHTLCPAAHVPTEGTVFSSRKLNWGRGPPAGSVLPPMGHLAMSEDLLGSRRAGADILVSGGQGVLLTLPQCPEQLLQQRVIWPKKSAKPS